MYIWGCVGDIATHHTITIQPLTPSARTSEQILHFLLYKLHPENFDSPPMPSPPSLPLETRHLIIDALGEDEDEDHETLKSCSLVCWAFVNPDAQRSEGFNVIFAFEPLLSHNPETATLIHALHYCPGILDHESPHYASHTRNGYKQLFALAWLCRYLRGPVAFPERGAALTNASNTSTSHDSEANRANSPAIAACASAGRASA